MSNKTSVIICAYNYARFLPRCLESVMSQTRPADEVIVVDDGSTDETPNVVAGFPSAKYIRQVRNGKASAFNRGFAASAGELICHLDADDYWLPEKLERTIDILSQSGAGGITHDAYYVDAEDKYLYGSDREPQNRAEVQEYSLRDVLLMCFIYRPRNVIGSSLGVVNTLCVWRDAVADCFPLPTDLGLAVDGALLLSVARRRLAFLPEKLSAYRHHGNNSFISTPGAMEFQRRLFQWALEIHGMISDEDKALLRALTLESEAHAAVHEDKEPVLGAFKAAVLLPSLLRLGLMPNWKHFGLPVASLFRWKKLRRSFAEWRVSRV